MVWLNALNDPRIIGSAGLIVGIIGIGVAIFIHVRSRQRKLLGYKYNGKRLLGLQDSGLPPDVTVQFRGNDIPRLTRSVVMIWNQGEVTITKDDLVKGDPLRIVLPDDSGVLSVAVLKTTRDVIDFKTIPNAATPHEVELTFDFLDSEDGAVIEVLHTGETPVAEIHGTVVGIPKGIRNSGGIQDRPESTVISRSITGVGYVAVGVGFILLSLHVLIGTISTSSENVFDKVISTALLVGLLNIAIGWFLLWTRRRGYRSPMSRGYPPELHVEELE